MRLWSLKSSPGRPIKSVDLEKLSRLCAVSLSIRDFFHEILNFKVALVTNYRDIIFEADCTFAERKARSRETRELPNT